MGFCNGALSDYEKGFLRDSAAAAAAFTPLISLPSFFSKEIARERIKE